MGLSNVEDILQAGLDGTDIPRPESRIAELLKEWIEQGGNIDDILVAGTNITLTKNADGTITIAASGEISAEDTVARAEIAAIKDGETLDSFGDVESALDSKADTTDIPTVPITAIQKNGTGITPVDGIVNITVPTQASDINAASATQGNKADTAIQGIKVNSSTVNPDSNKVVNITVPTSAVDVSALPDTTKYATALSLTINSSTYVITGQLKDQNGDNLGTPQTIDLPLESVVVGGSYNSQTKKVVLTLQNGNTIEFSVADLVTGLQTELSASNKLNPVYINYDSTHRAVSDTEKSTWNGKQSALSTSQLAAVNSGATAEKIDQIDINKNNILSKQDKPVMLYGRKSIGADYTLISDLTQEIGVDQLCRITAMLIYNDSAPRGLILSTSNDAATFDNIGNLIAKYETDAQPSITVSALDVNYTANPHNVYIWAKSASAGSNRIYSVKEIVGTF